jgi:glycosyltransferase involved in cell wall biosynthesis
MAPESLPLVSICLPNLNTRQFLEPRMVSLLTQTLSDWELIVCDSYSNDGAWEYFQKFNKDPRIRLFQVPREGVFAGWNECLKRVTGKYVYIATSDDTASPGLLERLVGLLEKAPEVGVAMGQFDFIDAHGKVIEPTQGLPGDFLGDWQNQAHRRSGWLDFLIHAELGTSWTSITSVLVRASLVKEVGYFRADVGRGEAFADRFWAMKSAALSDTIYVPERLATWRYHGGQASARERPGWRRRNLEMTVETIDECESRIPVDWRRDPEWKSKLLWGMRQYYLKSFALDRVCLMKEPKRFMRGAMRALCQEPSYFVRRMSSGLSWKDQDSRDSGEYLRDLIQEWHVPWPPEPLEESSVLSNLK